SPRRRPPGALGAAGAETPAKARRPPDATARHRQTAAQPLEMVVGRDRSRRRLTWRHASMCPKRATPPYRHDASTDKQKHVLSKGADRITDDSTYRLQAAARLVGGPMPRADIAILTVIPEEYEAVIASLSSY